MRARLLFPFVLGGVAGCAHAGAGAGRPAVTPPGAAGVVDAAAFTAWEAEWLAELGAVDPRLARRMPVAPPKEVIARLATEAALQGDSGIGMTDGALDVFSFGERARRLGLLRARLAAAPDGGSAAHREDRQLLGRLLDAEELRVRVERESPGSASERVRAIVATWGRPASPADVADRERLVRRGLEGVVEDVAAGRLSAPRSLELEDALDALERLAVPAGYPAATGAITALRVELGRAHPRPAPPQASPVPALAARLDATLGAPYPGDGLRARLREEEATLRAEARQGLAKVPEHTEHELLAAAALHVHVDVACPAPRAASPVRALGPPPERALVCDALRVTADAHAPKDELVATVALHDDVAVALWALDLAGGAADLDATRAAHPLLSSVAHDRQERIARSALVSPERAIAPGLAAAVLDEDGPSQRGDRAARWLELGDAPLELVMGYLARRAP